MTLKDILTDISDVVKEIIGASAIPPATKMDLHAKLGNAVAAAGNLASTATAAVETEAADLPQEAGGVAETLVEKVGATGGPVGEAVADMAAPMASAEASNLAQQFLTVFEKHNSALMTELGNIAKSAGSTAAKS